MNTILTMNDILHGDEEFNECFGDCDIWCTCLEAQEREKERMLELNYSDKYAI